MLYSTPLLAVVFLAGVTCQYLPLQAPALRQDFSTSAALGHNIPRDAGRPLPVLSGPIGSLQSSAQTSVANDAFILQGPGSGLSPDAGQHRGSLAAGSYFPQGFRSDVAPGPGFGQGVYGGPGPVGGQGVFGGPGPVVGLGVGSGPATVYRGGRLDQVNVPRVAVGSTGYAGSVVRPVGVPQVRRVDSVFNPTVTQVITIDRCVTVTDQAFNSVAVTLTSFSVQTLTVGTRSVLQTPVDDRVALQTSVFVRPASVTLTEVKSDFRIVTETSLSYVTLGHTSYVINQYTYTTTATQVLTYTATVVHTNINTQRTTFTNYRTVTDTVYVNSGYGYRPQ